MMQLTKCAERLLHDYFPTTADTVVIICDRSHAPLAHSSGSLCGINAEILQMDDKRTCDRAFAYCLKQHKQTLVLLEPGTFRQFQVYNWLDFAAGRPQIRGLDAPSHVSILPAEAALRVYGSDPAADLRAKTSLQAQLRPHSKYKIRTDQGTELHFTARNWLDQGNEILTAPKEDSVNGVIAVDGALFFQKIDAVLDFTIKNGQLVQVEPRDGKNDHLAKLYRRMTQADFALAKNRQLAEIGLGCNTGAEISECFMESEMVYGTAHFCFGKNVCYGGKNASDFHGGSVLIKRAELLEL